MNNDYARAKTNVLKRTEVWLRMKSYPRFHMLLIVSLTGMFGFLSSFFMQKMGVSSMSLRYPLAVSMSYLIFLGLLRLWLYCHSNNIEFTDAADITNLRIGSDFTVPSGDGSLGDALGALDSDDFFLVIIAIVVICAGFLVCMYIVWTGPALLAEVLVDGFVMARIYKRMKFTDQALWLSGALRRTWFPAVLLAVFFAIAGFAMQKLVPDAKNIGHVAKHIINKQV